MNVHFSLTTPYQNPSSLPRQIHSTKKYLKKDWNSIIKHHASLKNDNAILSTYTQMESLGISPDNTTLPLVFKACTRLNAVEKGKRIHSSIKGTNLIKDVRVGTALVDFYCKCGLFEEANQMFDRMTERDLVLWNAMISGCVGCGFHEEAVGLFRNMQRDGFEGNSRTMVALLLACGGVLELRLGKEIHGYCLKNGYIDLHPHVASALIGFYLNFDVKVSRFVFDLMVARNAVCWNALITGYFDTGNSLGALELFVQLLENGVEFDLVTLLVAIQACGEYGSLKLGMQVHQIATKFGYDNDLFIVNALLNMYSEIGTLELACELFDSSIIRDAALWNSIIAVHIEHQCYEEATALFNKMRAEMREDERTIVVMLSSCRGLGDGLKRGKSLHALACKSGIRMDVAIGNALLSMYTDLNCVESAQKVFGQFNYSDVISYNTLIMALARSNCVVEAWDLYGMMQESEIKPNSHTMVSLLASCTDETCLKVGQSIHGFVIKNGIEIDPLLNTALTDMYMNCGDEATARNLFEACPNKDLISWNAMIASCIRNNQPGEAQLFFRRMISELEPNPVTIINMLSTCTDIVNLLQGQCLHAYATRRFFTLRFDLSLANALITMYTRCSNMQAAGEIFKTIPKRSIISWNAMITGYSADGRGYDALIAFTQMLQDGFQPNGVTFLSVLSACRHAGLIEEGLQLFNSMGHDFNTTPMLAHYGCVVDLLCRAGCLDEARYFINSMPIEPDATLWRALLSACRDHSNTKLAAAIFGNLVELEPMNAGNYVLLSNVYAAAGCWPEVRKIRAWIKDRGLQKQPGTSWTIIRGQIHSFTAGDSSHPQSGKIYACLRSLSSSIRESGYVADLHLVLHGEEQFAVKTMETW